MKTSTSFLCSVVLYTILLQATALTAAPYALTLPPGWTLVANHLNHVPNNRLGNIFNAPLPPDGAMVIFFDQAAQQYGDPYTYLAGYGWLHPLDPDPDGGFLNPGEGAFFFNPTAATIVEMIGGAAIIGPPAPVALPLGSYCVLSHQLEAAATFLDIVGSAPAAGFCTQLYRWNTTLQRYDLYSSPGTLTAASPVIPIGEAVFIRQAAADSTPPTLVSATITSPTAIQLQFSEAMDPGAAQTALNYTLWPAGVAPGSVTIPGGGPALPGAFYQLNFAGPLVVGATYVLQMTGLNDLCGNPLAVCTVPFSCAPVVNDACAAALPAVPGPTAGTLLCATTDGYSGWDPPGCPSPDVWYTYTPTCNGSVTIDTCASALNTVLSLWDGCPSTLGSSEIFGDDDGCGLQSTITLPMSSCQTFYIRVAGANGASGPFTLTITETPGPPANDLCAAATVIGNGVFPFDTCLAATDGPIAQPVAQDVWFVYTPTCSGPVYISTCGSMFDTSLAVYSGGCAGPLMGFDDDAIAGPCPLSLQSYVTFGAIASTPYYIRVGSAPAIGAATGCGRLTVVGPNPASGTCPPGVPSEGGTGLPGVWTRMFQVTGTSAGTPWAWCISSPCCYNVSESSVPGVLPIGSPPAALVAAFVASINSKCPQPPPLPNTLSAVTFASAPDLMLISAYGCYSELIVSVGPALTPCESQCVVPNPFDFLPTAGPCSFNPPLREIPLSKQDCNTNGVDDLVDILQRTSKDLNQNRIPDECEACKRPRWMNQPVRQQVHVGEQAVFDARAQGSGKLDYQWLFNGRPVPGATQSRLVIDPVASRDAGEYQAVVTYDCGQLRSVPVQLAVIRSRLEIRFRAGKIEVRWQASNVLLQSATRLGGDWTTLTDAESPTIISPPFTQQFFRLVEK